MEAELANPDPAAGCGCAYPEWVDTGTVARSNRIMAQLAVTAEQFPRWRRELGQLPRHMVAEVGGRRVGIVHGDTRSLAGWDLAAERMAHPAHREHMARELYRTGVTVLASSHTCRPVAMALPSPDGTGMVINNGAAGMPNFRERREGLLTRIATWPPTAVPSLYGGRCGPLYGDAVAIPYDDQAFRRAFVRAWPPGSPAHLSYWARLTGQTGDTLSDATGPGFELSPAVAAVTGAKHG
ncbi:hypothetical protein [Thiohalorhabdus sp.]|uniref:hypothetical protein n=1 Tax=Thiohalorhabdus sp. TaxID=3094134 RepID=UPI002FC2E598